MTYIKGSIEATITEKTGYGTLGHLVEVLLLDREVHQGDVMEAVEVMARAIERADFIWDHIIGPTLDELESELRRK